MSAPEPPSPAELVAAWNESRVMIHHLQQQVQQLQAQQSSYASPVPPREPGEYKKEVAPVKPETFTGSAKSNPDRWLKEMERYLRVGGIPSDRWSYHASAYLRESASTWMESVERDHADGLSWQTFQTLFLTRFRPLEASRTARSTLATLRQKTSVDDYNNRFRDLIKYCDDMALEDQLMAYQRGLKPDIESEVYRMDPKTLEEAMRVAVRADMRQFMRQRERNGRFTFNGNNNNANRNGQFHSRRPFQSNNTGSAPMDLSAMQDGDVDVNTASDVEEGAGEVSALNSNSSRQVRGPTPNMSSDQLQHCRKNGLCFWCKSKGHMARDCSRKRSGLTPKNL